MRRTFRSTTEHAQTLEGIPDDVKAKIAHEFVRQRNINALNSLCAISKDWKQICNEDEEIQSYMNCVKKRYDRESRTTEFHKKGDMTWKEHFEYWEKLQMNRDELNEALDSILKNNGNGKHEHATYGPIGSWNVSGIDDMSCLFAGKGFFNASLNDWDVSNVTNMRSMFNGAMAFNHDIGSWDVGKVENMEGMFYEAFTFNRDIGSWDVRNVKNMEGMFKAAVKFDNDGKEMKWKVENVQNMGYMFWGARQFNRDIGTWDVKHVNDMSSMFAFALAFDNAGMSMNWNVSAVKTMKNMFFNAAAFKQDIESWNVRAETKTNLMFEGVPYYLRNRRGQKIIAKWKRGGHD